MSGTSLDGLDLVYCHIWQKEGGWDFRIMETKSVDYSQELRNSLKGSIDLSATELLMLHNKMGTYFGEQVAHFVGEYNVEVDLVSSHGHTVFHQPEKGLTYQIGSGQHLANACKLAVVCDFRTLDVSLGGHGAPLVPIGDRLFFSEFDFCLNLGGISNVSFESADGRRAYDISPVNLLLNHLTQRSGLAYDSNGEIARGGHLIPTLLEQLNALPYYKKPFPKSLGYEWFSESVIPLVDTTSDNVPDLLHTSVHHIAQQIAHSLQGHAPSRETRSLLTTGGGAKNGFLIETLQHYLDKSIHIEVPKPLLIDFKEALVFALMGVLLWRNEVNCLRSVTGASRDSSGGLVYWPN